MAICSFTSHKNSINVDYELFGDNKQDWTYTNYCLILVTLAADGIKSIVVHDRQKWISLISHPSIVKYVSENLVFENGVAKFTLFGVTVSYEG